MSRQSLGIILNGKPDFKQKQTVFLKIVNFIFLYAWIPLLIGAVIAFLCGFGQNSADLFKLALILVFWATMLGLISCLWSTYGRCPFCGHFFTLKRISGDKLVYQHDEHVTRAEDTYHSGVAFDNYGDSAFYVGKSTHYKDGTDTTKEFTFNSRCTCCHAVVKIKRFTSEQT